MEVLQEMAKGITNDEIAAALSISRSTVKFHVSNIISKLGTDSRVEAVAIAARNNLI
jgi:DNA-binding CsgD family transcriptional regulator